MTTTGMRLQKDSVSRWRRYRNRHDSSLGGGTFAIASFIACCKPYLASLFIRESISVVLNALKPAMLQRKPA